MSRKRASADSLDLLLDTICNTFGGVLFIAMLVIILLNRTSNQTAVASPADAASDRLGTARDELAASQAELDQLRRASQEQERLKRLFKNPALRELVSKSASQQTTLTAAAASRAANLQSAAQTQAQTNQIADSLAALDTALADARQRLARIDQQLQAERQLRTRTVKLPKQRPTSRSQVSYLLVGGRLYGYTHPGRGGLPELNTRDTREVEASGTSVLEPVAGGGIPVDPTGDQSGAVAQKIAGWNPRQYFVTIAVWPDSFEHFAVVRQILVERGFEYQLLPMARGDKIVVSTGPIKKIVQ
jgi:hypothetical protein